MGGTVVLLLGCSACTPNSVWQDTTGKGRTQEQAKADYGVCYGKARFPANPERNVDAFNAAVNAINKCMGERGWKVEPGVIKHSVQF